MKRALIVEDDRVWAQLLAKWCEQEDIAVEVAGSPQMAMDALDGAAFDVVVVDMLLAAETGMALLNEMAGYDDLAQIPVIVCTNSAGVTQEALAPYGVRAVLDKASMTPGDVRWVLREVVR